MILFNKNILISLSTLIFVLISCKDNDAPPKENEEEIINQVTLTFSPVPAGSSQIIMATYLDNDGEGAENPILSAIELAVGTSYQLSITMQNTLVSPPENIEMEIEEESDEHQFFFSWTNGIFSAPTGNGNINETGEVNYQDEDSNSNPLGLTTMWTTSSNPINGGTFRMVLKHQPNIKSSTTTSEDGETDIDITWDISTSE